MAVEGVIVDTGWFRVDLMIDIFGGTTHAMYLRGVDSLRGGDFDGARLSGSHAGQPWVRQFDIPRPSLDKGIYFKIPSALSIYVGS